VKRSIKHFSDIKERCTIHKPQTHFAKDKLSSQSFAVTTTKKVSWLGYGPHDWDSFSLTSREMFQGVINYIYFNSGNLYNRGELLLEYSSAAPGSDPANILNSNTEACFESGSGLEDCFAITFLRASVRPFAITIKSGPWSKRNPLQWCFVFQGWNSDRQVWQTLSERMNEARPCCSWKGYAIDTPHIFRKFRFVYTGCVVPGVPNFSFSAFEIHGTVFPDEEKSLANSDQETRVDSAQESDEFDPWNIPEYPGM
jgi:hypothetical protein